MDLHITIKMCKQQNASISIVSNRSDRSLSFAMSKAYYSYNYPCIKFEISILKKFCDDIKTIARIVIILQDLLK